MKDCNLEFSAMRNIAEQVLKSNLVSPISFDENRCDTCGVTTGVLYDYIDGYSHERWVCGACGLLNIPFINSDFRINNLPTGFLIIDPSTLKLTIITNSVNMQKLDQDKLRYVNWVESKGDVYACLLETIAQSESLKEKRYVIEIGKRMHQYVHLVKMSFGESIHIAKEESGLCLNSDLISSIAANKKFTNNESMAEELDKQLGYADPPTLKTYLNVIKEVAK